MKQYRLVSRENKGKNTIIQVNGVNIGEEKIIIAGPCAVESEQQMDTVASFLKDNKVNILRGGAYKPRTSPYAFQGLKEEGLIILNKIGKKYNMPIVSEAVSLASLELVANYCDMIQIGARNMTNYELLKALGNYKKPILLKRGMAATIEEFLTAAEYIITSGNENVVLCERGIRTFETYTRNTLDLTCVAIIKELSHLPIIADPSHGTGRWELVKPMAKASLACGADGIMIEVHPDPYKALSDGEQSLNFTSFKTLMEEINPLLK
ncbi:3-deoxy-7-phosphoheptulonate synthase [Alkalicella caledoniensis]|uniref:3-deoxy-7-phosphoheptulonate synthase n=1 Tax=Alkalicella caledoniensis TaxID=2731377 RepID=A0A7G9W4C7_ALKCA|nr:3-deoxy-7-phosphoheptulonate synthase [Alkalicella caledoniensis]QNO13539.1 3-deoxy-7-phosphoheptulonate synthase [Alkalicella caledoniensis]